ncbi:MAG: hypothetical protein PHV20_07605 [Bacteroidales bacterium]|nr:hypothetical protein [Bacteroidales bacterium]
MKGIKNKIYSNRRLSKRFKLLNRINFCGFKPAQISKISCLRKFPFDLHDLEVTDNNYIYRACINENEKPYDSIARISYNPNPMYLSRANVKGQPIGYYTCALDISIIEGCQDSLRNTKNRKFSMTVTKWKIKKKIALQIISNSQKTQKSGTDLNLYCKATKNKRFKEMQRKDYRTYFLKTRFIADQYAKTNIKCENDYLVSALHSKTLLNPKNKIDGLIYPSVGYFYYGFNYAFPSILFENNYFELSEAFLVNVEFCNDDYMKYPIWNISSKTFDFDNNKIKW